MEIPSIIKNEVHSYLNHKSDSAQVTSRVIDSFNNPFGSNTYHNLLVSGVYNQTDKERRAWLRQSLPSQELGMTILLTSISSSQFFERIRMSEIDLVLKLANVANSWARTTTDLHITSPVTTSNPLGLANLCLGLSGIDSSNKEFVTTYLSAAIKSIVAEALTRFNKENADIEKAKISNINSKYESYSYRHLRSGMTAVEEVNGRFLDHVRKASLAFSSMTLFNTLVQDGTFSDAEVAKQKYFSLVESSVIGFVKGGDDYFELIKLYLSTLLVNLNTATKTIGTTTAVWEDKLVKTHLKDEALEDFIKKGISLDNDSTDATGIKLSKLWENLQNEVARNVAKNSSLSLIAIRETIRNITTFKHEFIKYIDDQTNTLTNSYKRGDELFKAYKSFLQSVKNSTDVNSATDAMHTFRASSVFTQSLAGLIHGMCENRETIDASIVNDIANIVIDEQVIAAFNRGPFQIGRAHV